MWFVFFVLFLKHSLVLTILTVYTTFVKHQLQNTSNNFLLAHAPENRFTLRSSTAITAIIAHTRLRSSLDRIFLQRTCSNTFGFVFNWIMHSAVGNLRLYWPRHSRLAIKIDHHQQQHASPSRTCGGSFLVFLLNYHPILNHPTTRRRSSRLQNTRSYCIPRTSHRNAQAKCGYQIQ